MNTMKIKKKNVKMIAHRGMSGLEKENTCAAFVAAGNRTHYGIETDVHKTADGKFIVIHDETPERITNGGNSINVEENNYDLVKDVLLPDVDGSTNRTDLRIPLLEDYIRICKKYEKVCVLELKNAFEEEDIKAIIAEIEALGYLKQVIFISFVFENCVILRKLLPKQEIQWLTSKEITDEVVEKLIQYQLNLDVHHERLSKPLIKNLHKKGIKVNCWTCDQKERAEALVKMGVDFITTNILE